MPEGPQAALAPRDLAERERVAQVTRLYLVVHGRPPDRGGLATYVGHMRNGGTLPEIATEFIESEEFAKRVPRDGAATALRRNALGPDAGPSPARHGASDLGDLAASFVLDPAVQERLPILPALYPDGVPLDDPGAYRTWLLEKPPDAALAAAASPPKASFIMLLDRPDPAWLSAAITSALAQPYPQVEVLAVARGWFPRAAIRQAAADARLRLVRAPFWQGRAARFNQALARCTGDFAGLVGQHDQLAEMAMAGFAGAAATADIVLSDDDAIDAKGLRHSPRLGTAWDPDRVVATGCPGLMLARTALLRQVGGMRPTRGQEEWDLLLRASAAPGTRITHVPSILLSRRDPAQRHGTKRAHRAAAQRHLAAAGHGGCAVRGAQGALRVAYPLPKAPPLVSIIIPTRDRADLVKACMAGLLQRTAYPEMEVVILDNGSTEPQAVALLRELARDRRVRVLPQPGPFNWSALNNFGVGQMRGDVAVLLNNDTEAIEAGWLRELVSQAIRPEVGIVGAKLLYADRTVQHAGVVLGPAGRATHMWRHAPGDARGYLGQLVATRQATVVTGACLAIRREVYQAAGGCEADGLAVTWNDSDLCLRVRALGLRVLWTPHARLLHLEQATRGTDDTPEHQARFARERAWMRARWNGAIDADPFHNPNLIPDEAQPQPRLRVEWRPGPPAKEPSP